MGVVKGGHLSLRMLASLLVAGLLCGGLFCPAGSAAAGEASALRISQTSVHYPEIKAYLHVLDGEGQPADAVQAGQLNATIGTARTPVTGLQPFAESGEGVAYIMLVDISKSIRLAQFKAMQEAMLNWVESLADRDRMAIVTFGADVKVPQDYTSDKAVLKEAVTALAPVDDHTQLHLGLVRATEMGRRTDPGLPDRRVIITLSDGEESFAGGVTKEEVLERIRSDRLPIYALGFFAPPLTETKQQHLNKLGEFARSSGGALFQTGTVSLPESYEQVRQQVRNVLVARLDGQQCPADGRLYRLQMNLAAGTRQLTDGAELRLYPAVLPSDEGEKKPVPISPGGDDGSKNHSMSPAIMAGGLLLLIAATAGLLMMRKKSGIEAAGSGAGLDTRSVAGTVAAPDHTEAREAFAEPRNVATEGLLEPEAYQIATPAAPKGITLRFTLMDRMDPTPHYERNLVDRIVIGKRTEWCDLVIDGDEGIDKRHCELLLEDDIVIINDLGTGGRTWVNGVPISERHRLYSGDLILLGRTELRIGFS
ncbi:VWA domain-containing protein [Heliobacterium undosum]|uniref:VWA domain-containing protein n=1 Tax=Heliomicrobium undosum TaxID=121734 RepID=A0A845LA87_9FIRM|nr:VWA domain-containing protein [Heliomicrobium undosum]MZP29821.1 VWA domain-containing protein [Heliomicrobium undosum]